MVTLNCLKACAFATIPLYSCDEVPIGTTREPSEGRRFRYEKRGD